MGNEKYKKNILFVKFSQKLHESSLKYDLDNRYSLANTVTETRSHHSFIPTSCSGIEMRRVLSDEIFSNMSSGATSGYISDDIW